MSTVKYIRLAHFVLALCVAVIATGLVAGPAQAATQVSFQFVALTGASLADMVQGAPGRGALLYYTLGHTPDRPNLVVLLQTSQNANEATARIYDDTNGNGYVDISRQDNNLTIQEAYESVIITTVGRWWVRDGVPNYNLNIQVLGPVCAMWGAGSTCGGQGYLNSLKPGIVNFEIQTRDPEGQGIPKWDFRSLIPEFSGEGVLRANYAERKCENKVERIASASPDWPYVAVEGSFEQAPGRFQPPIIVDWASSRIKTFAELVPVRAQNCSYSIYSISPIRPGEVNTPDFEAPFAFYDLSGQHKGLPNLIVRFENYDAHDRWFAPELFKFPGEQAQPIQRLRYSWRNDVGDGFFDYKLGMFGSYTLDSKTPIRDGDTWITAPAYEDLPAWVIGKSWPMMTFIDTDGKSYGTSEGIYQWQPGASGLPYLLGMTDKPDLSDFTDLPEGFRGEYRYLHAATPSLYLSPIDRRLHLPYADGGMWKLDQNLTMQMANLGSGQYINSWKLMRVPPTGPASSTTTDSKQSPIELQALYAMRDHLIYSGPDSVQIRRAVYQQSAKEVLPPTDHASWLSFRDATQAYLSQKHDPTDLASWLGDFPGTTFSITGGHVRDMRVNGDGFRFVLDLKPNFQVTGDELSMLRGLAPGSYVVSYNGSFRVEALAPAAVSIQPDANGLMGSAGVALHSNQLRFQLVNRGLADTNTIHVIAEATGSDGETFTIGEQDTAVLGSSSTPIHFEWTPPTADAWKIQIRAMAGNGADSQPQIIAQHSETIEVAPPTRPSLEQSMGVFDLVPIVPLIALLICLLTIAALAVSHMLRVPAASDSKP